MVVELAYLLCQLRNLSSVVAVISALLQTFSLTLFISNSFQNLFSNQPFDFRPIKKLTGNVWEKGTKLTEPAASYYKWMVCREGN